ncbi:hypothetical protein A3I99_00630 [Candidatus Kaiserbacteria bacterium RIFCSPLOWO2_02_FULL_45_11b]|uniref:Uncharacterized protein n=1 Tax=Candidatus Kaiserbacteria bacterium RIFCSPLOWO2_12_FULL_45_26 TaxID=1798525 RepID=A0A1F6FG88_9BACT|nr:MAG: hypothetical protein A2929_01040 [Candidatus Kaiserbacteria bacterium RIFCSPLOWO2_01_FULL_45_25]OGG84279.1 MAG: hypothetical protein A3I99_00630 [Candidatus Kaiserbacteria bacterium RIFCSPLOWO2_02_FULL_45_11b]OGG84868.1 MAG: hypothetical protein A3G90_02205 [Candidatus Kaiserbacteria bacterium RIFCSPLOWO2_12_FULL_45_26]
MINLDKYFSVWKQRLAALRAANDKIKVLPKEAQYIQALIVRNACTDFVTELESGFESILADYVSRQDELFLAAVDNIHWTAFTEKIRPPDLGLQEQKKALTADVSKWAVQAAEFEASVMQVQAVYIKMVSKITCELTITYGVSLPARKKRR